MGVSPLTPSRGYKVEGAVNGIPIVFLLDTGAAVTLLRSDAWARVFAHQPQQLKDWSQLRLVGADGSPLTIHGSARVSVELEGELRQMDVVVVSPLTTEAILGLDFLTENGAQIDLASRTLQFSDGPTVSLHELSSTLSSQKVKVRVEKTTRIPPRSELEIMACLDEKVGHGTWLLEQLSDKMIPAVVARALIREETERIPVRLLNTGTEPVVV